ncbi:DUF7286 family protein [Halobacterium yunchengense]|uniref:DUF7286 family protein n=1 Tax=Halobacterium yunchengense TaxID=3108497 RepID=UPI0030093377
MNFADDDRARVPFALVGVVLLVGSATAAAALATHDPAPSGTEADRATDRAVTGADAAVAAAARTAAANAVEEPVVAAGESGYGAALDPERPFRDALALRVYASAERALREQTATAGAASAAVSLPRIEDPADAASAVDAVALERVGERAVRVTVSGVRVVVRRGGHVVAESSRNVSVVVHTPALAVRERVQRFERLLDRGALDGPGLDRRLTDYLHRVVWLRGPLQYGGAPIANVLANRHVELMANRALLGVQRTAFGRSDAAGERAYGRAVARVGLDDVLAVTERTAKRRATDVLGRTGAPETPAKVGVDAAVAATDRPDQSIPVGVNGTADDAFLGFVDGDGEGSLDGTLRAAFTAVAVRHVDVTELDRTATTSGAVSGNWTLEDTSLDRDVAVAAGASPRDVVPADERVASEHARRVTVTERERRVYANGDRERAVVETTRTTYRVTVGVGYEFRSDAHPGTPAAADRVLAAAADTVSPAVRDRVASGATRKLVADAGGVDDLAERAVAGDHLALTERVTPPVPAAVRERAYRAAAGLRGRARNVSANVSTRDLAGGRVPTDALRDRVDALHDPDRAYGTATGRAVAAVRETYLARVDRRLRDRRVDGALADVGAALGERGLEGAGAPGVHGSPASGDLVASVDGSPAYLTLGEVTPETVAAVDRPYHPLAARNVNWFTVPHGDAASAVVDAALPAQSSSPTVRLDRAAQALAAANGTLARADDGALLAARENLTRSVASAVEDATVEYRGVLAASNLSLTAGERRAATRAALGRWDSVAARATAVANGSAADRVAAEAAVLADATPTERDRLDVRLRAAAPDVVGRESARVDAGLVGDVVDGTRRVARTVTETALSEGGAVAAERAARRLGAADVGAVPAGLPLAPVPGYWYATTNAWSVSVEGSWARFAVRAEGGSPVGRGDGPTYVREDGAVAFDVDGDGRGERVGRNERLSFAVNATVGVVVPSGPRGVGDVDGDADERSPGW